MRYKLYILPLLIGFGLFLCLYSLLNGSIESDFENLYNSIFNYNSDNTIHYVIINLRMPRLIMALATGCSLALSGYLFQSLLNNPLADPYILGTASGASLGANLVFIGWIPAFILGIYTPPIAAFAIALLVTLVAILFAYKKGRLNAANLLLAGVALSSMMTAMISLMSYLSENDSQLRSIIFWIMGSFERSNWSQIPLILSVNVIALIYFSLFNKSINVLLLGEEKSEALGLNVKKMRWIALIGATLLTSVTVAYCGAIGFVGFLIPHFVRGLFGFGHSWNLFYSAIIGAFFMVGCDILSKMIYPPAGLPLGILTSFLGIPFFLYLLMKSNYRFS
ncbi:MAG: iron ABC transporter permease [Cytophagales bacterium]